MLNAALVNSLPKTVTRQRRDCDLNPGTQKNWFLFLPRGVVVRLRPRSSDILLTKSIQFDLYSEKLKISLLYFCFYLPNLFYF